MFEPAAHMVAPWFEYMARSTTSGAAPAPRLSTIPPNRFPTASGNSSRTLTLKRLLPPTAKVRVTAGLPSSNSKVTFTDAVPVERFATR